MENKEFLQVGKQEFYNKLLLFYSSNGHLDAYFLNKHQVVELVSVEEDAIGVKSVIPDGQVLFSFKVSGARYLFSANLVDNKLKPDEKSFLELRNAQTKGF